MTGHHEPTASRRMKHPTEQTETTTTVRAVKIDHAVYALSHLASCLRMYVQYDTENVSRHDKRASLLRYNIYILRIYTRYYIV